MNGRMQSPRNTTGTGREERPEYKLDQRERRRLPGRSMGRCLGDPIWKL